jgi:hypothetical protein
MTRRDLLWTSAAIPSSTPSLLPVPVHRVMDAHARCTPEQVHRFWSAIWPEAVRDFRRGGMELKTTDGAGEVRRSAADNPVFVGLRRGVINLLLTSRLPLYWDNGRALAGTTTLWDGYAVCMIALSYAHGNQIPFVSVNTCVHEILHALMQDIFVSRPKWYQADGREFRSDSYATGLWLFHDGAAVRQSAQAFLDRLRSAAAARKSSDAPARH